MEPYSRRNFSWHEMLQDPRPIEGTSGRSSPHGGIEVPLGLCLSRDLGTDSFSGAGALIGDSIKDVTSAFIGRTIVGKLGGDFRVGLDSPSNFPLVTSPAQAQWVSERGTVTPTDMALAWAQLTPKRVSIAVQASSLLAAQSVPNFDSFIQQQLEKLIYQALDQACLNGAGGASPIGILNQQNIPSAAFSGSATNAALLAFPQAVKNGNTPDGSFGWAVSPDTEARWKNLQKFSGSSTTLMDDRGYVCGYPSQYSTELNSANGGNRCIFGNWNFLKVGIFGTSAYFTVDPYTLSKTGEKLYTMHLYCDAGVVNVNAFYSSSNASNS